MSKPVLAWWFAAGDVLPHGDGRRIVVGETHRVEDKIVPCERGLHASVRLIDALQYAPGPYLYRVRMGGTIVRGSDKLAASERTYLWRIDATRVLHLFACDVAEEALVLAGKPDPRSIEAIHVKRRWVDGTAADSELAAAWAAAWAAVAAAGAAARAAAWDAAGAARDAQNRRLVRTVMAHRKGAQ